MEELSQSQLECVARRADPDGTVLRSWRYHGGSSAQVTGVEVRRPDGAARKLVVRAYGDTDLKERPRVARDEFTLLQFLHSRGLPVPLPVIFDESGSIVPRPYSVVEHIDGEPDFSPANIGSKTQQIAAFLAGLHTLDWRVEGLESVLTKKSIGVQSCCTSGCGPSPCSILHGDFWPGNILWREDQLVGVIDWEDSALGDPLADLSNARLEILWTYGEKAMEEFTSRYRSSMKDLDFNALPYWDLRAAKRLSLDKVAAWGLDIETERIMGIRHRWFVENALSKTGGAGNSSG